MSDALAIATALRKSVDAKLLEISSLDEILLRTPVLVPGQDLTKLTEARTALLVELDDILKA